MLDSNDSRTHHERQLDAIIAGYYRSIDAGDPIDQKRFVLEHPEFESDLNAFFEDLGLLQAINPLHHIPDINVAVVAEASSIAKSAVDQTVRYFGEYEILEELGAGGMGVVYKARQAKLKRIVALKMIRSREFANSQDLQRFEAEAKAAAGLSHPGIVSVHEVGIYKGQHFYTMDYVEGGSLLCAHRGAPVESKRAADLVRQLAESMHYAHQQGIVHRDLKPANILLTAKGAPRITDFGLAKRLHRDDESEAPTMTESGQILGTAGYMSPEQAAGKSRLVGPASDIYSLGAVLYALLTSRAPFVGETPAQTIMQVLHQEPASPRTLNPAVPRDLETICLKCLQKAPHRRYGAAHLLADDLRLFLEGKPVNARPVSSIERGWRWCRRNIALTVLSAVILFSILAGPMIVLRQVSTTVDGVQDARGDALTNFVSHLHSYPSFVVNPVLIRRFQNETIAHRKLNLALASASLGLPNSRYLVTQTGTVTDHDTTSLFEGLAIDRELSLKCIQTEAAKFDAEKNWRAKSQLAILALYFGETSLAEEMCRIEGRADITQRTIFIDEFPKWYLNIEQLADIVRAGNDSGIRSAVLLGVGSIPESRLSSEEKLAWRLLAVEWFKTRPDAVMHSACDWLLRQWNVPLPSMTASTRFPDSKDWIVNSQGLTLLRIPAGSFPRRGTTGNADYDLIDIDSFWIADREISVEQFQQFMNDPTYPATEKPMDWLGVETQLSPTPLHPVQCVNWWDVVMYCNWLSLKEGLTPAYEKAGQKVNVEGKTVDNWYHRAAADGYRIPLESEWEYACRAGTTTLFSTGEGDEHLKAYSSYSAGRPHPCGTRFPNGWGLFDMHGNITEMCGNSHASIAFRGGAFNYIAYNQRAKYAVRYAKTNRLHVCGFRLVRKTRDSTTPADAITNDVKAELAELTARGIIKVDQGLTSAQYSSDGAEVLVGGHDRLSRLVCVKTGEIVQTFQGHQKVVWSVALSPDGQTAVTGSEDQTLRLWDVASGLELDRFAANGIFSCVRYSADGTQVYATNWDGMVRIWKHADGKLGEPLTYPFNAVPLDIVLLSDDAFAFGNVAGKVFVCDASTGIIRQTLEGHSGWVHGVCVLNEGLQIVSASHDSTLLLWDPGTAKAVRVYLGHQGGVNEVRALPEGRRFLSCGADGTLRLWDSRSGRELARGKGYGGLRALSTAPDGKSCVSAGLDGSLLEWELPEAAAFSSEGSDVVVRPQMLTSDAFQEDFMKKRGLKLRPARIFADASRTTRQPVFAIEWEPTDGRDFIVRHDMNDLALVQRESEALRMGYQREQIETVSIDGVNHHIGLWRKVVAPQ